MKISLFGYTVQIYKTNPYCDDLLHQAAKLKTRSWKVALVRVIKDTEGLSLKSSLKKVEDLFDFDEDGNPIVK